MRKKLNQLIAMTLIAAMAAGSGLVTSAEETTTDKAETATVETVADTAVEVDEAADPAANDKWYQEAIGFLAHLGIFTGDENGDMKPEDPITRAEIAAIILREMNVTNMSTYNDIFSDVDSSHWAADVIQTAYDNNIINGFDDGTFRPDDDVTYEQAVKMIMCAINYESFVEPYGGYPMGYLNLANEKEVTEHVEGKVGEPVIRRSVAKMVYNSLTAEYPYVDGAQGGVVQYTTSEDVTILSETRDLYYIEGVITAAPGKSIDLSISLKDGQIAFEGELMESELVNPEQYVAEYVKLFYRDYTGNGEDMTAVYAFVLDSKTETVTFDADVIESIVTGYEGGTALLEYEDGGRIKNVKLENQPVIVYNDQPFTMANFTKMELVDSNGDPIGFDEFITPEEGTVKLVDFDDDDKFDILFVESYETSVVKVATALRLQLEYPISIGDMIKLDPETDADLNVKVLEDGDPIELRDLSAGDVISVRMNANFSDDTYHGEKYITIETTFDYVDGVVETISEDDDAYVAKIDGIEYKIVNNDNVISDINAMMGTKGTFHFNKFGRIAFVKGGSGGGLSGNEEYGWIMNVYADDSGEDIFAKMYTSGGEVKTIPLAASVDYWAPDATSNSKKSAQDIDDLIGNESNDYFLQCSAYDVTEPVGVRLCKYKTNGNGKITRLYLAVDEDSVSENSEAVRFSTKDHKNSVTRSGLFDSQYYISEGVPQFTVPLHLENLGETETYGYRIVGTSEFSATTGEDPLGYHCFFADITDTQPGVSIKLVKSTSAAQDIEEYSTADDNPVIVISSVNKGVDDEGEEIYVIKGYRDGKKVEYTTASNVLVAQVTSTVRFDKETYDTTTIWTHNSDADLTDVLHRGDICGMAGSTSNVGIILRMVDTKGLANHITGGGEMGTVQEGQFLMDETFSPTRDRVVFGYVTDVRTSPIVQYDLKVTDIDDGTETDTTTETTVGIADLNRAVQFVNVSSTGKVTVEESVSDAYEVEVGDYVFMRNFKNDASRELFVIRFN